MNDEDEEESRFQLNEAAEFIRRVKEKGHYETRKQTLDFERGALVFREGQVGDAMFIVQMGEVDILKRLEDGSSRILRTMGKGDFFGEMSLIDKKPRSASAVCRSQSRLVRVPAESLVRFIESNPQFVMRMLNTFVDRLRSSNSIIERAMVRHPALVVLDGIRDFLKAKPLLGPDGAFDIDEFAFWANYRLGIPEVKIPVILKALHAEGHLAAGPRPDTYQLVARA